MLKSMKLLLTIFLKILGGEKEMANTNSNRTLVPEAKDSLNQFKYEVATEVGVNLKNGYNGDISAKDAGRIGGNMVKKMIQKAESQMLNK